MPTLRIPIPEQGCERCTLLEKKTVDHNYYGEQTVTYTCRAFNQPIEAFHRCAECIVRTEENSEDIAKYADFLVKEFERAKKPVPPTVNQDQTVYLPVTIPEAPSIEVYRVVDVFFKNNSLEYISVIRKEGVSCIEGRLYGKDLGKEWFLTYKEAKEHLYSVCSY